MATINMFLYSLADGDGTYTRRLSHKGNRNQDNILDVREVVVTVPDADVLTIEQLKQLEIDQLNAKKTELNSVNDSRITEIDNYIIFLQGGIG